LARSVGEVSARCVPHCHPRRLLPGGFVLTG
jgi:hypothetical protein